MNKIIMTMLALVLVAVVAPANAQLVLTLYDGTNIETVYDTNNDGFLSRNGAFGSWTYNVTTALGSPAIGDAYSDAIDLNSVNVSGGVGSLFIYLTETDLGRSPAPWMVNIGGTTMGSAQFAAGYDAGNTAYIPGTSTSITDTLFQTDVFSSGAFAYTYGGGLPSLAGPYSLTLASVLNHTSAQQISSFDFQITVPEPATLLLMGIGLLGLGITAKRRKV